MRCTGVVSVMVICALTGGRGFAQTTQPERNLSDIVRDLGNEKFSAREAAQEALEQLSPGQVEVLRQMESSATDEEVKVRLHERIVTMDAYLLLHSKPMSLHVTNATLGEVTKALNAQLGGGGVACLTDGLPIVTLDAKDQPFWEIVRQINAVQPVAIRLLSPSLFSFSPAAAGEGTALVVRDGVAIVPRIGVQPSAGNWYVEGVVYFDPRVRVVSYAEILQVDKATDQDGRSVTAQNYGSAVIAAKAAQPSATFRVYFASDPQFRTLRELRGGVDVDVQVTEKTLRVDLTKMPSEPFETPYGRLQVREVGIGRYALVRNPTADWTMERNPRPLRPFGFRVLDAAGKALVTATDWDADGELSVPDKDAAAAKVVEITMPEKTRRVTVPIVLTNLPVPTQMDILFGIEEEGERVPGTWRTCMHPSEPA